MKIRLDHVGVVGRRMQPLIDWAKSHKFSPTEPKPLYGAPGEDGAPVPLGQESAHVVLEQGYIELSAVEDLDRNSHLAPYLAQREGLLILAFESDDLETIRQRCGPYNPTRIQRATREITYGEKHGWARFDWFMLSPQHSPDGLVCFVHPHDKALIYQPAVTRHPNGMTALTCVDIVADAETRERYQAVLGVDDPRSLGVNLIDPDSPRLLGLGAADGDVEPRVPLADGRSPHMIGFEVSKPLPPEQIGGPTLAKQVRRQGWPYVRYRKLPA